MPATILGPVRNFAPGLPGGVSAAYNITAAQAIKVGAGRLCAISCVVAGTITVNDSATVGGANAANEIYSGALTPGATVRPDWPCTQGITVSAVTGTGAQFALAFS